jgi:hypothetical protein
MGSTTVWEVYLKTQEMRNQAIKGIFKVPISAIAKELAIETELAEECAIVLQELDLVQFDINRKEIILSLL